MPPKPKVKKEEIISTATEIALESGINQISVRNIARKLNCSTAPIYVNFTNTDELLSEVGKRIEEIFAEYMTKQYCNIPLVNMGIGAIVFANKYKCLYIDMVLNDFVKDDESFSMDIMQQDVLLQGLEQKEIYNILKKLMLITNGLCMEVISEASKKSIFEIIEMLFELGEDVINIARVKNGLGLNEKFYSAEMVSKIIEENSLK